MTTRKHSTGKHPRASIPDFSALAPGPVTRAIRAMREPEPEPKADLATIRAVRANVVAAIEASLRRADELTSVLEELHAAEMEAAHGVR